MKYVKLLRKGAPVWGVLEGETVRTLRTPPFGELNYDGERLPLADCTLLAPCEATKSSVWGKTIMTTLKN